MAEFKVDFTFSNPSGDYCYVEPCITVEHLESLNKFEILFCDALPKFVKDFCRKYEDEQWI